MLQVPRCLVRIATEECGHGISELNLSQDGHEATQPVAGLINQATRYSWHVGVEMSVQFVNEALSRYPRILNKRRMRDAWAFEVNRVSKVTSPDSSPGFPDLPEVAELGFVVNPEIEGKTDLMGTISRWGGGESGLSGQKTTVK
jgi:hypothetical protein